MGGIHELMRMRCWFEDDYFAVWYQDKLSMIETMIRNMLADLDAGYDFHGGSIGTQLQYVEEYYEDFRNKLKEFKDMREPDINKWCYKDMIERGAMEEVEI